MRILWAKTDFLHPTNRGGQIRTLEILRRLHRKHEIHYIAYDDPSLPEGPARAVEYASRIYPVQKSIPPRGSPLFFAQLGRNLLSPMPLAVGRYRSARMGAEIAALIGSGRFDAVVADFLAITANFRDLSRCVLFQHNVESDIWRRHQKHATGARGIYFASQARRMRRYERHACRTARQVIAVSPQDAETFRAEFGAKNVRDVPTGVDIDFFRRPSEVRQTTDLVFVGAMDWLPNVDGARWFMGEIFPRILACRPNTTIAFVGRNPVPEIQRFRQPGVVTVTGTVADVRPHVWGAKLAIVPLRIGGGTRLKIFEAMAAEVPVVSTGVGAEGLAVTPAQHLSIADAPDEFARATLHLLDRPAERERLAAQALELVTRSFSWESVACCFESLLESGT